VAAVVVKHLSANVVSSYFALPPLRFRCNEFGFTVSLAILY